MAGLSRRDVLTVVNRYIGVDSGYLGDFSYRTHADFYFDYCDLDIDPNALPGTTRERFIQILSTAEPGTQARILHGVIARFPVDADDAPTTRTQELRGQIQGMAARLDGGAQVPTPSVQWRAEAVDRALRDAEHLIERNGPTSAVDRVHTALHGYLAEMCATAGIQVAANATLTVLFKAARKEHAALQPSGARAGDVDKILRAFASVLDALSPLRNKASMAHPQGDLLAAPEAMLVVHATRTLLHYLEARVRQAASPTTTGDLR